MNDHFFYLRFCLFTIYQLHYNTRIKLQVGIKVKVLRLTSLEFEWSVFKEKRVLVIVSLVDEDNPHHLFCLLRLNGHLFLSLFIIAPPCKFQDIVNNYYRSRLFLCIHLFCLF